MSDYLNKHPVFSKDELANPELLGAPTIPVQVTGTREHVDAWANNMGLHHGDAIRLPNGAILRNAILNSIASIFFMNGTQRS
jgi:hypothetical protein